jgi:hypothetical protein
MLYYYRLVEKSKQRALPKEDEESGGKSVEPE